MKTTPSPAAEWPPGGAGSSTRSASQGRASTDFGALLDTHQARTAVAEGPKKQHKSFETEARQAKPAQPEAPVQQQVDAKPVDPKLADDELQLQHQAPATPVAPVAAEIPAVLVEQQPVDVPVADVVAPAPLAEKQAAPVQPAPTQPVLAAPVATPAEPEAAAPVAEQAAPVVTAPVAKPQADSPVAAGGEQQPVDAAPEQPVVRADKPAQPQGQAQPQPQGQAQPQPQQGNEPRQQQQQPQAGAERVAGQPGVATQEQPQQQRTDAAAAAAEPRAERSQPQPVQANPSTTGVTNAAAPNAPQAAPNRADAPVRAVPLSRAADAVENVIRLGSQRGVTHARLSLKPAELGGIEIRLQQTASGLTASVVADGAQAAQALQQAGADLRRQLESHGIQLQSLDISYSGDERGDARSAAAQTGEGERRSSAGDSSSTATDGGELTPTEEIDVKSTLELPEGVLVDVLA